MKSTDLDATKFTADFTGENTLIVKRGADLQTLLSKQLPYLEAKGCTVIITDSYLFNSYGDAAYENTVKAALISLEADKIIFTKRRRCSRGNVNFKNAVKTALNATGCSVDFKTAEIHNRYWLNYEKGKGMDFPSLNGVGRSSSTLKKLVGNEFNDIISELRGDGISL